MSNSNGLGLAAPSEEMTATLVELGFSGRISPVAKGEHEGLLYIDAFDGRVLPNSLFERPEWAEGLTLAQLTERHIFYNTRIGPMYTADMRAPEAYRAEDLGWLGLAAPDDGEELPREVSYDADEQFRMEQLSTILGIPMEADENGHYEITGALEDMVFMEDNIRTNGQMQDFLDAGGHMEERKSGTHEA